MLAAELKRRQQGMPPPPPQLPKPQREASSLDATVVSEQLPLDRSGSTFGVATI